MAILSSKSEDVSLILRPIAVRELSDPVWLEFQCRLTAKGRILHDTTLALTSSDVIDLWKMIEGNVGVGQSFESTDADFILLTAPVESDGDVAIAFFTGEPYVFMKGYRYIARAIQLATFASELRSEFEQFVLDGKAGPPS